MAIVRTVEPSPVPDAPDEIVIHEELLEEVHAHCWLDGVTPMERVPAVWATDWGDPGETL